MNNEEIKKAIDFIEMEIVKAQKESDLEVIANLRYLVLPALKEMQNLSFILLRKE